MATPKEYIVPGNKVIVTNQGKGVNTPVVLTKQPGSALSGFLEPPVGAILTIAGLPRKTEEINTVKVKYQDQELEAYYCTIRYSTDPRQE